MILGEFLGHFDVRPAIETGTNVPLGRRVGPQMRSEVSTIHNGGGSSCLWTF